MLRLLKNTTFSTAVDRSSDIIKKPENNFWNFRHSTVNALCDVSTDEKVMS